MLYDILNVYSFSTLSITMRLPVQGKLARVVQHHELFQQALDHLSGRRRGTDVQLFHAVTWEVEGGSVLTLPTVSALWWRAIRASRDRHLHSRHCDGSTEPQMDFDETCVRAV